jgi:hypothetical protein
MNLLKRQEGESEELWKERVRQYHRAWRKNNHEKSISYTRKWVEKNRDSLYESIKSRRKNDLEYRKRLYEASRRWMKNHPEKEAEYNHKASERRKLDRKLNPEKHHEINKKIYQRIKEKESKRNKKRRLENPQRYKDIAKKSELKRLAEGRCKSCGGPQMPNSKALCEKHWFNGIATFSGIKENWNTRGEIVKDLLEKQNRVCPYTGVILVPGINASLDHKNPKCRFPKLYGDINNLEWIDLKVNEMKRYLTTNELIALCHWIDGKRQNDYPLLGFKIPTGGTKGSRKIPSEVSLIKKEERQRRLDKGLCSNCTNPRMETSNIVCEKHWFYNKITKLFKGSEKFEFFEKVKKLFYDQQAICPYTGVKLIPGVNASLDHKIPASKRPDLKADLSNLEWVDTAVNHVKNNLTPEEFRSFCHTVSERFPWTPQQKSISAMP